MRSSPLLLLASFLGVARAHGDHGGYGKKPEVPADASWMVKHMAEEHHADHWDAASFFTLHDFNSDGYLEESELLRTYGVFDESNKHVTKERKEEITKQLMDMLDTDHDGFVSHGEFLDFIHQGKTLPDLGLGPGHHGDDEYEYEIHHWEKYHDENTKLEDLTHPEDIKHFEHHEKMELEQEKIDKMMASNEIMLENVPSKFRRQGR
ncbi:hypothetical protein PpBr36_04414 [Pyricularia pennisetigena]|uniref:hypothetical protein n=1 Tax=Pyricularia pennisetigena TaxID=1578925 RepID=UPI0011500B93|nr:hypothetical protein PpBr36_04414 [Pyricularia pennisetigena]TLS27247.1 hypothetical protein PpBr36_04414 [Pyricularia pennisetigena]